MALNLRSSYFDQYILISNLSGAESIGGIFNTLIQIEDHGNRVLVEQSAHEMKKGSFDIALRYLDKALSVSTRVFYHIFGHIIIVITINQLIN